MREPPKRKPGRQPVGKPKRQVLVAIEVELIAACVKLGEGNMSAGIRLAIAAGVRDLSALTECAPNEFSLEFRIWLENQG